MAKPGDILQSNYWAVTDKSEVNDQQIQSLAILKEIRAEPASDATTLAYSAPYKPSLLLLCLIETENTKERKH